MFEDSPESFIQRWRSFAAEVQLFARPEGSPLLECLAGGVIVQLLERTGPYLAGPGRRHVILNPMVERLEAAENAASRLEVRGLGQLHGVGKVLDSQGRLTVVDCGAPLVVAVLDESSQRFEAGRYVAFEALPPVHGFVIPQERDRRREAREGTDEVM